MTDAGPHSPGSPSGSIAQNTRPSTSAPLWGYFLGQAAWVTCLWLAVYGGANWITGLHSYRVGLWTNLDLAIPFVPLAAPVYLSVFPMLWLAPLMLRTRDELHSYAKALGWLIVISGVVFVLLPAESIYTRPVPNGVLGTIFQFADQLNMTHNFFPSLHVGMAATCAYAYSRVSSRRTATIFWLWAAAIAVSTLLIHEHYLADVPTGGLLGIFVANQCRPNGHPPIAR